jgi:hypothetical protein
MPGSEEDSMATRTAEHTATGDANGSVTKTKAVELNVAELEEVGAKTKNLVYEWTGKLSLAGLGLAATVTDEVKDFWDKLFLGKLVKRGELVQKNAEGWMKDMRARLR